MYKYRITNDNIDKVFTFLIRLPPALKSRNYRLFFGGQGLSLIGNWITQTATIWLVYQLTNSSIWLGVVGFVSQIPNIILAPIGGIVGDRVNRRHLFIVTQFLSMIQSFTLAILAIAGIINIWHIVGLSLFQGLINAFDAPTRQALVPEMVEKKEDLASALAKRLPLGGSLLILLYLVHLD